MLDFRAERALTGKTLLFCPAHYRLSMTWGSEHLWASELVLRMAARGCDVIAVTGDADLPPAPRLTVIETGSPLSPLTTSRRLEFVARYTRAAVAPIRTSERVVLHHTFPFLIGATFNPLPLWYRHLPFVLGPVQAPLKVDLTDEREIELRGFDSRQRSPQRKGRSGAFNMAKPLARFLSHRTVSAASVIVAVSQAARDLCLEVAPEATVRVVPPGVDDSEFKPSDKPDPEGWKRILVVGSLVRRKQVNVIIRGFSAIADRYPLARLVIVGDGPERPALEALAAATAAGRRIDFIGFVPHNDLPSLYRTAAMFCTASTAEAAATAPLEAMASGLPVIATPAGIMGELLSTYEIGILLQAQTAEAVSVALASLLDNDQRRGRMARQSRVVAERKFSWDVILDEYADIYEEAIVVSNRQRPQ